MSIHIAITRRVRPGCEAEFQAELRAFFQASFTHHGVWGASMLTPPPESDSREFGILRTFASEAERDAFYASPMFLAWEERSKIFTEGEPIYRQLHGLEAWFAGQAPPRWKMAVCTLLGVYPTSLLLSLTLGQWTRSWPLPARTLLLNASMVLCLTWLVMPFLARLFRPWLNRPSR